MNGVPEIVGGVEDHVHILAKFMNKGMFTMMSPRTPTTGYFLAALGLR